MNETLLWVASNLGISLETLAYLIFTCLSLIPFARGFKEGVSIGFFGSGLMSLWFYAAGYNYSLFLITMFMYFILMCFSLFAMVRASKMGGIV